MDAFEQRTTSEAGGFIGKGVEWGTADSSDPVDTRLDLFRRQD
jgi:hypothetical protein